MMTFYSYQYLMYHSFPSSGDEINVLAGCLIALVILVIIWLRGHLTPKNKDLVKLLAILLILVSALLMNDLIDGQSTESIFRNDTESLMLLADQWHVAPEKIAISTERIEDQTIYLIDSRFFRVFWGEDQQTLLFEELSMHVKGRINIIDK